MPMAGSDWSRRTELVLPDHDQAKEADPLVGVHDELRLARQHDRREDRHGLPSDPHAAVRAVMDPAPSLRPVADPDCRRGAWQLPTATEPLTVIRAPETTR